MEITRFSTLALLFTLLACGAACSGLTRVDGPAQTRWWLRPYTAQAPASAAAPGRKVSVSVTAVPGLDSDRVLALSGNAQLSHYAGARWVDHLPEVVESLVSAGLETAGFGGNGAEQCRLELEIEAFFTHLDRDGRTESAEISMGGRFHCAGQAARHFGVRSLEPVREDRMEVIVASFQAAMDEVTGDLLATLNQ